MAQVRRALDAHESGSFYSSAQMVEAMGRDDRISAVLSTRVKGMLGLPFDLHGGSDKARDVMWDRWLEVAPEWALATIERWATMMGFALAEIVWRRDSADEWIPTIKPWHPMFVRFDHEDRTFKVQTVDGEVPVTPGDGKWILHAPSGWRPWMQGSVRSLSIPWLSRTLATRDWNRSNEVHGMPIRGAVVPNDASEEDVNRFWNAVQRLGNETSVKLPQNQETGRGFDLKLIESGEDSHASFDKLITSCNVAIAIELLGQNLTTEVQGGSYAAASIHERIRIDYLQADAECLATTLHYQLCRPWAALMFGDPEVAPWPHWDATPVGDHSTEANTLSMLATAIETMNRALGPHQMSIDVEELSHRFGLPIVASPPGGKTIPAPPPEAED